jgi:hypothetical protein
MNIREIAMGENKAPEPEKKTSYFDDGYGTGYNPKPYKPYGSSLPGQKSIFDSELYDDDYGAYNPSGKSYLPDVTPKGQLKVSMSFSLSELGNCADDNHPEYDWGRAIDKATELGYDAIEKLAGKGYESRYELAFKAEEGFLEYEVTVTLTPLK